MSENLNTLRRQESGSTENTSSQPSKKYRPLQIAAQGLPWGLLVAFILVAWWLFGDRFEQGRSVELVKAITVRVQESTEDSHNDLKSLTAAPPLDFDGPTLFQASGWIEPDPLMLRATTLYSGVVEAVHVLEGERVQKDQLLATMVDDDAELDLKTAEAEYAQAHAALISREAQYRAAEAFLTSKAKEVAAALAKQAELMDESTRLNQMGPSVISERDIRQAALRVDSQNAIVEASQSQRDEAQATLQSALAAMKLAEAGVLRAEAEVSRKALALERTSILSPVDGRIQRLFAAPGKKRMLAMDDLESATIATLYQPEKLQARIDVPLEEAAQLAVGQPVRLRSVLLSDQVFQGRVSRIDGQADIQRNTLQAKVEILNPADKLRPEMLCRAEFLPTASGSGVGSAAQASRVAIYVAESALIEPSETPSLWAIDATGKHLELREVTIGQERKDDHIRILNGLRPGDLVVNNPAADLVIGDRVKQPTSQP